MRTGSVAICLALVALVLACRGEDTVKTMALGEVVSLKINESAQLATNDLAITLKAVTSDSRCPHGVQCVWAGEADVVISVRAGENRQNITVTVGAAGTGTATVEPYVIRILELAPYPVVDRIILDSERVIELRVDRTDEASIPARKGRAS